jgi:hypothetical protein
MSQRINNKLVLEKSKVFSEEGTMTKCNDCKQKRDKVD